MDGLGAKLLSNINKCFLEDQHIDEYDFIGSLDSTGKNHNPIILIDHKLGVEAWAVQVLLKHAYSQVSKWLTSGRKQINTANAEELKSWTRVVLLVVADFTTAWNIRKELTQLKYISFCEELQFTSLVLTKHPKSNETFSQKKWLLSQLIHEDTSLCTNSPKQPTDLCKPSHLPAGPHCDFPSSDTDSTSLSEKTLNLLSTEILTCHQAACKYPNNYIAWTHRIWLMEKVAKDNQSVTEKELKETEAFVMSHVSDHSGWHYRQYLLDCLQCTDYQTLLIEKELELNTDLITRYVGHEALWYHRRYLLHCMIKMNSLQQQILSPKKLKQDDKEDFYKSECLFVEKVIKTEPKSWQAQLGSRYNQWLQTISTTNKK